jgi:hypothetical protein
VAEGAALFALVGAADAAALVAADALGLLVEFGLVEQPTKANTKTKHIVIIVSILDFFIFIPPIFLTLDVSL